MLSKNSLKSQLSNQLKHLNSSDSHKNKIKPKNLRGRCATPYALPCETYELDTNKLIQRHSFKKTFGCTTDLVELVGLVGRVELAGVERLVVGNQDYTTDLIAADFVVEATEQSYH